MAEATFEQRQWQSIDDWLLDDLDTTPPPPPTPTTPPLRRANATAHLNIDRPTLPSSPPPIADAIARPARVAALETSVDSEQSAPLFPLNAIAMRQTSLQWSCQPLTARRGVLSLAMRRRLLRALLNHQVGRIALCVDDAYLSGNPFSLETHLDFYTQLETMGALYAPGGPRASAWFLELQKFLEEKPCNVHNTAVGDALLCIGATELTTHWFGVSNLRPRTSAERHRLYGLVAFLMHGGTSPLQGFIDWSPHLSYLTTFSQSALSVDDVSTWIADGMCSDGEAPADFSLQMGSKSPPSASSEGPSGYHTRRMRQAQQFLARPVSLTCSLYAFLTYQHWGSLGRGEDEALRLVPPFIRLSSRACPYPRHEIRPGEVRLLSSRARK